LIGPSTVREAPREWEEGSLPRYRLMIPGPVDVLPHILAEMGHPITPHYGADWVAFYNETLDRLRTIWQCDGEIFILPGSGSAGLEAALVTACPRDGRVLVVENGFFGMRLVDIARSHGLHVEAIRFSLGTAADPGVVRAALEKEPFDLVVCVHCETSAGILNPVQSLAAICREFDVLFMVDAISSLGIEPFYMDDWGVDIGVTASQKGLETPPGLAVVAFGTQAWERVSQFQSDGWYLNLKVWKDFAVRWADWHPYPITQAVNNVRALRRAMDGILEETLIVRWERHRSVTQDLRCGLVAAGFQLFVPDDIASHGVTAVLTGAGKAGQLSLWLRENHRVMVAGGFGESRDRMFRIGHMGPGASADVVGTLLSALRAFPTADTEKSR
jgi:alanine-glyoxylate transaminase/serine-glyoxylate transaminase/serine-pyruvate transaminase